MPNSDKQNHTIMTKKTNFKFKKSVKRTTFKKTVFKTG